MVGMLCPTNLLRCSHGLSSMDHGVYSGYWSVGNGSSGTSVVNIEMKKGRNMSDTEDSSGTQADLVTLCKAGQLKKALCRLDKMDKRGILAKVHDYVSLLQACIILKDLEQGKQVHARILKSKLKSNLVIENALINMYCKCGNLAKAHEMFDNMVQRDVFTWTTMIAGYAEHGPAETAFNLFWQMEAENIMPDEVAVLSILKACTSVQALEQGKRFHAYIQKSGIKCNIFIQSTLVDMYSKCGSIECARQEFNKMLERDVVSWNTIVSGYVQHGDFEEALNLFLQMVKEDVRPDRATFLNLLKACASLQILEQGEWIHDQIIKKGFELDVFVGSTLVGMYAKCGSLEDAQNVFDKMPKRTVVSWNAMIVGYALPGHAQESLKLFWQMESAGFKPTLATFVGVLKACAILGVLEVGEQIDKKIVSSGVQPNIVVGNALVDMYAKCGSIARAQRAFNKMQERDVVSWNSLIAGYAQHGYAEEAFEIFKQMEREGMKPDKVTFLSVLKACASLGVLEQGKQIHSYVKQSGLESDIVVASTLIDMYAKCRSIENARAMFDTMLVKNVVTWNAMIAGYVQHCHLDEAFMLFQQMEAADIKPGMVTFLNIVKACSSLGLLEHSKHIHNFVVSSGCEADTYLANSLVDMYAKCGSVDDAHKLFDSLSEPNVVSWNSLITGHAQQGQAEMSLELIMKMDQESVKPNEVTFITALNACANLASLDQGRHIHVHILLGGFETDVFVGNSLIDMYAKCKSVEDACSVFNQMPKEDVVTWNTMIAGYSQLLHDTEALKLFREMGYGGLKPDEVTLLSVLKACTGLGILEHGKQVHACIMENDFDLNSFLGNALIDMYAKCGSLEDACQVFDNVFERDIVSWNAMITGCIQHCQAEQVFKLFGEMEKEGVQPDRVTFLNILKACGSMGTLEQGEQIHDHINVSRYGSDIFVRNALIDMYGKCGSVEAARQVFDETERCDAISWNSMITGYAQNGYVFEALELFHKMPSEDQKLDHITFVNVLSVCSHAGLVNEGCHYFDSLSREYGITPTQEHYACMIDILGRAGLLQEAVELIEKMPFQPGAVVWMGLLGGCRVFGNRELAKQAAESIIALEPHNTAAYVLLSNIYAVFGRWEDKALLRQVTKDRAVEIEVNNQEHLFVVGDVSHPQIQAIHPELQSMYESMELAGYNPDTCFVWNDVEG